MYVRTYVRTYVRRYVRTYVRTCVRTYVLTYVRMYVCMYVCMSVWSLWLKPYPWLTPRGLTRWCGLGQHAAASAQRGVPMSGADGPSFSNSGLCPAPSVDGSIQHGPRSDGIQGDPNASTPHLTSQPGTHGASDAEWNATLDGNSQGRVGSRRQCREDDNRSGPSIVGRDLVGTERGSPTREANREASHAQTNQGNFSGGYAHTDVGRGSRFAPDANSVGSVGLPDGAHGAGDNAAHLTTGSARSLRFDATAYDYNWPARTAFLIQATTRPQESTQMAHLTQVS